MINSKVRRYEKFWNETTYEGSSRIYQLAKDSGLRGVGVDYVVVKKEKVLKSHYHNIPNVLILVLEGHGILKLDGKNFRIKKGDVITIPPKTSHGFKTSKDRLVFLSIQSPPIYGKAAEKDTYFV